MSEQERTDFLQVYSSELAEIESRRRAVNLSSLAGKEHRSRNEGGSNDVSQSAPPSANGQTAGRASAGGEHNSTSHEPLTGLALSGGGMRSACIGLGLLQALYRKGILRHVDYLSTVSGGGFAGSLLSSSVLAEKNRGNRIDWRARRSQRGREPDNRLDFDCSANGPQPPLVREIAAKGESLRRPILFANRWFWGFLVVNAFVASGLLALASFAAWGLRSLDERETMIALSELGFDSDAGRAFLPAIVLFILWLLAQVAFTVLRRRRSNVPEFPTVVFGFFSIAAALGAVSLLATDDLDLRAFQVNMGISESTTESLESIFRVMGQVAAGLFTVSILPLLRPGQLLRSGANPHADWQKWLFHAASFGVVLGVPLLLFFLMAQEDITNYNASRPNRYTFSSIQMSRTELGDFWRSVGTARDKPADSGKREEAAVSDHNQTKGIEELIWEIGREPTATQKATDTRDAAAPADPHEGSSSASDRRAGEPLHAAQQLIVLASAIDARNAKTWEFQRWFRAFFSLIGVGTQYHDHHAELQQFWDDRRELAGRLNDRLLSDPTIHHAFHRKHPFAIRNEFERIATRTGFRRRRQARGSASFG